MHEWLIIGGGVHGTAIANKLLKATDTRLQDICMIDPHKAPIQRWIDRTAATGMQYLRSPGEHSLDVGSTALYKYAREKMGGKELFYSDFNRPALRLFNAHSAALIDEQHIAETLVSGTATTIKRISGGYAVDLDLIDGASTSKASIAARRVVIATGESHLDIPEWAQGATNVVHLFDKQKLECALAATPQKIAVIGGGISAAQCATRLARQYPGSVSLIHKTSFRIHQFDTDRCWVRGNCLEKLKAEADYSKREKIVDKARLYGSFPVDVRDALNTAIFNESVCCRQDAVAAARSSAGNGIELQLESGERHHFDLVILATGFTRGFANDVFISSAITDLGLPCTATNMPITDKYLRWSQDLFVSGRLAELTAGPFARNIFGAQACMDRIMRSLRPTRFKPRELQYYHYAKKRG